MSYVIASYGITLLAIGGYALSLYNEHRRLRDELSARGQGNAGVQEPRAPDGD